MSGRGEANDFRPTADWAVLRWRAELLRNLREFFHENGFLEVETPLLSADTVVDRHLDPIDVAAASLGVFPPATAEKEKRFWLQTSPEFGMKRLLAAGAEAIYQITRSFRAGERGALHNCEFTIVEWYRVGDTPEEAMDFLSRLASTALGCPEAERLSYAEAFERYAGVDPHRADTEELRRATERGGFDIPESFAGADRDAWLDLLLVGRVEPQLGRGRPTILFDYPASQAALARVRRGADGVEVAERFELYVEGLELANGYHELLDADRLLERNRETNRRRVAEGKRPLPEQSRLIAAMRAGLPACCGVALGLDRLLMAALGLRRIDRVMAFPIDRA